ncbi:hypothetical protein HYFRA_00007700 [Hymenoscyphus fraxineus]|uniref:Uncharacterized protein n=1 Tax=Hymenoscyphus fraxineus TaxID=746836 RepID=A0A9N9KNZ1_9HELO|nr:hypothetical protein HYFRA_00007700 [Hymenoscyphus fraxineus]
MSVWFSKIEDSVPGVEAGRRAGMPVIVCWMKREGKGYTCWKNRSAYCNIGNEEKLGEIDDISHIRGVLQEIWDRTSERSRLSEGDFNGGFI